jgi:hypothetical protein
VKRKILLGKRMIYSWDPIVENDPSFSTLWHTGVSYLGHVRCKADNVEWNLWNRIQNYYHDLLRAKSEDIDNVPDASPSESQSDISDDERDLRKEKRKIRRDQTRMRVKRLRGKVLPNNPRDADAVQEWMDRQQYVLTVCFLSLKGSTLIDRNGNGWKISRISQRGSSLIEIRMSSGWSGVCRGSVSESRRDHRVSCP